MLVANLVAATQDIATDGLAVDILEPHERGLGQRHPGRRLPRRHDPRRERHRPRCSCATARSAAFLCMAAFLVTSTVPVLFATEVPRPTPTTAPTPTAAPTARASHFLRRADAPRILALIAVYKLGDAFATAMLAPFLRDHGFSARGPGRAHRHLRARVSGMLGALLGGALVVPLGCRRALVAFGALQICTMGAYAGAAAGAFGRPWIQGATVARARRERHGHGDALRRHDGLLRPESAATDVAVQASAFVIAGGAAQMASGFVAQRFGYVAHFSVSAVLAAASAPAVLFLYTPRVRPSLREQFYRLHRQSTIDTRA